MSKITSIDIFFLCLGLDAVISAIKVNFDDLTSYQVINNVFFAFMYNFIIAMPAAIVAMFMWEYFKKKERNETIVY